jgi:hypothetical protein
MLSINYISIKQKKERNAPYFLFYSDDQLIFPQISSIFKIDSFMRSLSSKVWKPVEYS